MYKIEMAAKVKDDVAALKKENPKLANKVLELIFDIFRDPYDGIGKPEALKGDMAGWWSRRITDKHRIIYKIDADVLKIASCYGHYDDK